MIIPLHDKNYFKKWLNMVFELNILAIGKITKTKASIPANLFKNKGRWAGNGGGAGESTQQFVSQLYLVGEAVPRKNHFKTLFGNQETLLICSKRELKAVFPSQSRHINFTKKVKYISVHSFIVFHIVLHLFQGTWCFGYTFQAVKWETSWLHHS